MTKKWVYLFSEVEEAEKKAEEFFQGKEYEGIEITSCAEGFYSGWELTSRGQITKSEKPRIDELKVVLDDTGKVLSY